MERTKRLKFLLPLFWGLCLALAPVKAETSGKVGALLYKFNLDLTYLSEMSGFTKNSSKGSLQYRTHQWSPVADAASIGMARSELELGWYLPRGAGVEVVFRPDALNGGTNPVELDSRSGRVVEPAPSLHFMDEYRIIFKRPSLESHLGVVARTLEDYCVAPELLGFGLRVQGPKKSFSAGFSSPDLFRIGTYGESERSTIGLSLDVLSGRDDRHDSRVGNPSDVGQSPAKREPYWGGAASVSLKDGEHYKAGISVAALQEKVETGIRQVEWYQVAVRRLIESPNFPRMNFSMEGRHLKQTYRRTETSITDERLTSFGLISAIDLLSKEKIHFAIWYGAGEIHPESVLSSSVSTRGAQSEIGWSWMLEDQLELGVAASREWRRDDNLGGGTRGGFGEGASGRSTQSRFALRIGYLIGDQI